MKLCANCKNEIANEAKFCGHCGAKQEGQLMASQVSGDEKQQAPTASQVILSAPAPKAAPQSQEDSKAVQAAGQVTEFVKGIEKEQVLKSAVEFKQNLFAAAKRPGFVRESHINWKYILINFSAFWLSLFVLAWASAQSAIVGLGRMERAIIDEIYESSEFNAEALKGIIVIISIYVSIIAVVYAIKKYVINPTTSFQYIFARFSSYLSTNTVINLVLTPFALLSDGQSTLLGGIVAFFMFVSWLMVPVLVTVTDVEDDKHKVPHYYSLIILLVSLMVLAKIWFEILQ